MPRKNEIKPVKINESKEISIYKHWKYSRRPKGKADDLVFQR